MKKLIYASHTIVNHVDNDIKEKVNFAYDMDKKFWTGTYYFSNARYGKDYCPLKIHIDNKIPCPIIDLNFQKNFEEVTNNRALELLSLCVRTNRKLGVYYSGGIDSTVAVAALIKCWPASEYGRIEIFLNHTSVLENYYFFRDQILANNISCTFLEDTLTNNLNLNNYVLTDGEPADKLWFVNVGLTYFKNYGKNSLLSSWKNKSKTLKEFISSYVGEMYATRYFDTISESLEDFDFVVTVGEWFSWINFNYHLHGHLIFQKWLRRIDKDQVSWENYQNFYQPWFITSDYQQWAWGNNRQERFIFKQASEYKQVAKKYIFDITKDDFYYKFKSKMASNVRFTNGKRYPFSSDLLIFEDGSGLSPESPEFNSIIREYLN